MSRIKAYAVLVVALLLVVVFATVVWTFLTTPPYIGDIFIAMLTMVREGMWNELLQTWIIILERISVLGVILAGIYFVTGLFTHLEPDDEEKLRPARRRKLPGH